MPHLGGVAWTVAAGLRTAVRPVTLSRHNLPAANGISAEMTGHRRRVCFPGACPCSSTHAPHTKRTRVRRHHARIRGAQAGAAELGIGPAGRGRRPEIRGRWPPRGHSAPRDCLEATAGDGPAGPRKKRRASVRGRALPGSKAAGAVAATWGGQPVNPARITRGHRREIEPEQPTDPTGPRTAGRHPAAA